jgi:hypothetical protein
MVHKPAQTALSVMSAIVALEKLGALSTFPSSSTTVLFQN